MLNDSWEIIFMSWVTEHPFWMSAISASVVSVYGITFHYFKYSNHDWEGVILWIPFLWIITYLFGTVSYFSENRKK